MKFGFHNHWWSLPFASIVKVFAVSERSWNIKKNFRCVRVKNCTNLFNTINFRVKCFCFTRMSANIGIKIVISIISRAVAVNEILNFMSALVEKSDIFGKFLMNQLVTVQILRGNISTQQKRKGLVFSKNPNDLEFSELSNDQLVSDESLRQSSFSCRQLQQWLVITKILIGCGEPMMKWI